MIQVSASMSSVCGVLERSEVSPKIVECTIKHLECSRLCGVYSQPALSLCKHEDEGLHDVVEFTCGLPATDA